MNFVNRIKNYLPTVSKNMLVKLTIFTICLLGTGIYINNFATLFTVNGNKYTYADISTLNTFYKNINVINGATVYDNKKGTEVKITSPTKDNIFQSITVTAMKKAILDKAKIQVNREVATKKLFENNPYRGTFEAERNNIGDDQFYKLIVETAAINQLFNTYYLENDSQRMIAINTLAAAKSTGIVNAGQTINITPKNITIAWNNENKNMYQILKQTATGSIVEKFIEDNINFYIIQPITTSEQGATFTVIEIPRTPMNQFILAEAKQKGITVSNTFYSPYRIADLSKPDMFFAAKAVDTTKVNVATK